MDARSGRGNWGRWSAADERGTANLLTRKRIRDASRLVQKGRVYSLALPIKQSGVPVFPSRTPPLHFMTIDGGDYAAGLRRHSGFQSSDDYIALHTHGTTHIDALAHVWHEDTLYNGFPGDTVRSSGAKRCGIDKLGALVGRGVLLDLCAHHRVERLAGGHAIARAELEECARAQGTVLGEGDIVLVRTGWLSAFEAEGPEAFFAREPGLSIEAARFMGELGVVAVGMDNFAIEVVPTETGESGPVHQLLIRDYGTYLMELFVLDELAQDAVHEFLFVAAPLRIAGGVGSPLNPLAIA